MESRSRSSSGLGLHRQVKMTLLVCSGGCGDISGSGCIEFLQSTSVAEEEQLGRGG